MHSFFTPGLIRFLRYAGIGIATLTFDLLLIAFLTQALGVPYYISTPIGFLIAVSINYILSRRYVFHGTKRPLSHGYLYFITIAVFGAFIITGAVYLLVTYLGLYFLVARVVVAGFVGMANYLTNLYGNFKVAGLHP